MFGMFMFALMNTPESQLPEVQRLPKTEWREFLGYKIASSIGIAACAATTSKGIAIAAKSGCDILTYKTIRCYECPPHSEPNITYIHQPLPLTYDDIGEAVTAKDKMPIFLSDIAIANSFGNQSKDPEWVRADIQKAKQSLREGQVLIVSIFGDTYDEWIKAAHIALEGGADIIEANFSCPNLSLDNAPIYTRPNHIFSITQALVQAIPKKIPLIIKYGIFTDYQWMKNALYASAKAGAQGICGINSVPMKVINDDGTPTFGKRFTAGVSGKPIQELALDFIKTASTIIRNENLNLVILGVGGITMPFHFSKFFAAGATIVLSATGMMYNPCLAAQYHEQSQSILSTHKEKLANKLFDIGVIKFGDFTFKSGIRSNNYIDMRLAMSHPDVLRGLAFCLADIQKKCQVNLLCPVPYAAVPVTTVFSLMSGTPMIMARKEAKNHGTKKMIEGVYTQGQNCLIIEDVVTTGASVLETIKVVEDAGLKVKDVVGLINRQQGGEENITSKGYKFHSVFTLQELLSFLKKPQMLRSKL